MRKKGFHHTEWWSGLLAALLTSVLFSARPAQSENQGITIFSISQQDLNGDGRPDLAMIDCAFATEHDRIHVVDQQNDMGTSTQWQAVTDFKDDVWLYDIGADGTVQLIVVYRVEQGRATASVYDDQDGDGQVRYRLTGTRVDIQESPYWTARIESGSDWLLPDGRVNLNVRFRLDGPIPTFDRAPESYIRDWLKHDGHADAEFEVVADSDGIARYAVKRLLAESPPDWGFERSGLQSNEGRYPTLPHERAFFPFLPIPIGDHDSRYTNLRYFDLPPDVRVDWSRGKVMAVELPGYPIGHGYHFNDGQYIFKDEVNDVSFESPQAYYDLANDGDAFPDLHIRFFTRPAYDRSMWSLEHMSYLPWQSIRYDWNLFNPGTLRWDFKVGLLGNHTISSVVSFRDFAVRMVPFAELPHWVMERKWKLATFIAREGAGYESSEGIYEWQPDTGDDPLVDSNRSFETRDAAFQYMQGVSTTPPDSFFTTTHPGYRAERHFAGPVQPYLYFSPLDRKLHLRGAEFGVWNIDGQNSIRYADLDGDSYLDQWQYFENGALRRQLYLAEPYLIYADEDGVLLKKVGVVSPLFETLPPRTHEEWLLLRQQLTADQRDFAPGDFKAMVAQFQGQEWRLDGATLRGFRPVGKGYRFVLQIPRAAKVSSSRLIIELGARNRVSGSPGADSGSVEPRIFGRPPGAYVVSYRDKFRVEPLTPPALAASITSTVLRQREPGALRVVLRNNGLEDLPEVTFELWAESVQGPATTVATQTVTLLAQTPVTTTFQWVPPAAGPWTLTAQVRQPGGQLITFEPEDRMVLPAPASPSGEVIAASTSTMTFTFVVLGLVGLASIVTTIFWWNWRRREGFKGIRWGDVSDAD